ncbi:hypothetical protein M3Y99_01876500 [Aphelenchoides fujianensis]|nr:hypothetical protein M3Y99_01876500 [Aphelenchoides fujianensis]
MFKLLLAACCLLLAVQSAPQKSYPANNYYFAFDTTSDVSAFMGQFYPQFPSGLFLVYSNGAVNTVGARNYQTANGYWVWPEALVQLQKDKDNEFGAFIAACNFVAQGPLRSIWVDVTDTNAWGSDKGKNAERLNAFLQSAVNAGLAVGVLASKESSDAILGSGVRFIPGTRVWYVLNDQQPSLTGYTPIGGVAYPSAKQYALNQTYAGVAHELLDLFPLIVSKDCRQSVQ